MSGRVRGWPAGSGSGALLVAGLAAAGACGPAAAPAASAPSPSRLAEARQGSALPQPVRSGALRQDQISLRANVDALRIEVTPLDDWVLDVAAPDTRARLARIRDAHRPEAARRARARDPALFLVSFSSARAGTEFHPEDLHLIALGLRKRPLAILAVTAAWGRQQLDAQSSAAALYAFDAVDVKRDFVVSYQGAQSRPWADRVPVIEAERLKTSGAGQPPE